MKSITRLLPDWLTKGVGRWASLAGVVVLVVATGTAVALTRGGHLPEGTAFEIDGDAVSTDQVDSRIEALTALYGVKVPSGKKKHDTFRRDATKSLAVQMMMEAAAQEKGVVIADKKVTDALTTLVEQRYPDGNRQAFIQALADLGASEAQVKDEIEQQMVVARLFDEVTKGVSVTSEDVKAAFEERKSELAAPERRGLRNIVVQTRKAATQVLRAVKSGASFPDLAKKVSIDSSTRKKGGNLGLVSADQMETGYAKRAFRTRAGQPFGPVKTKHGWNVGLVERVVPGKPAKFDQVEKMLKKSLVAEESMKTWQAWLKDLIQDHDVVYAPDYEPEDPDAVPPVPTEGEQ